MQKLDEEIVIRSIIKKGTFPDKRSYDKWVNNYALEHDKITFDKTISYFKFDSMSILQDEEIRDK